MGNTDQATVSSVHSEGTHLLYSEPPVTSLCSLPP